MKINKGPPPIGKHVTTSETQADEAQASARPATKSNGVARRTLEKLGQKVSHRPAPEVSVEQRAGKTAALRMDTKGTPQAGTWAAIDLGSSSAKMLVMRTNADGSSTNTVSRRRRFIRIPSLSAPDSTTQQSRTNHSAALSIWRY